MTVKLKNNTDKHTIRRAVRLSRPQIEFLERLSRKCLYSGGRRFTRTAVIRCLMNVFKELDIDARAVKSEKELKQRILKAFCRCKSKGKA